MTKFSFLGELFKVKQLISNWQQFKVVISEIEIGELSHYCLFSHSTSTDSQSLSSCPLPDSIYSPLHTLLTAAIDAEVTDRTQGMNPLLVIWTMRSHACWSYQHHGNEFSFVSWGNGQRLSLAKALRDRTKRDCFWLWAVHEVLE